MKLFIFLLSSLLLFALSSAGAFASEESTKESEKKAVESCDQPFVVNEKITEALTDDIFKSVIPCLRDGKEKELVINSGGGDAWTAYGIYDALRVFDTERKLVTHIFGNGHSAAVILFLAGERRIISCHSNMLLHSVKANIMVSTDNQIKLDSLAKFREHSEDQYVDIMTTRTSQPADRIKAVLGQHQYHDATDVLELGIATEISSCE